MAVSFTLAARMKNYYQLRRRPRTTRPDVVSVVAGGPPHDIGAPVRSGAAKRARHTLPDTEHDN